jgi:hypothetical protein
MALAAEVLKAEAEAAAVQKVAATAEVVLKAAAAAQEEAAQEHSVQILLLAVKKSPLKSHPGRNKAKTE